MCKLSQEMSYSDWLAEGKHKKALQVNISVWLQMMFGDIRCLDSTSIGNMKKVTYCSFK